MNENLKRWLISSGVTFLAGFCIVVLPELDNLDMANLTAASVVGAMFVGLRGGIKAVAEAFLLWYSNRE